ncbi:MAG: MFS transporter [Acidobacteriaceae bacterium]
MTAKNSTKPSRVPEALQRSGIYYGWVAMAAGTVGVVMSVPGQTMGVSVYTDHLLQGLSISRTQLSIAYMLGTLASAILLPMVGRLLDRLGARILGVIASIGLALSLAFLANSPSLLSRITAQTRWNPEWVGLALAFVGFLGIRHFGQGQLTMTSRTMIGRWFERRRGFVFGLSGLFVAFGFGIAPLLLNHLIDTFHWQTSLLVIAGALVLMAGFVWLTFRNSPEECGLEIDGGPAKKPNAVPVPEIPSLTAPQAARTSAFWIFNFGLVGQALISTAITFHMGRLAQLNGMSTAKAFSVFLPVAFLSTACDFLGGLLSDRIPLKYLLATMQLGMCLGLLGMQTYGTTSGFTMTAVGLGVSNGLYSLLSGAAWPRLFGRRHLGAIAGLSMGWIVAGSAVGPFLFSLGLDARGNFHAVLYLSLLLPAIIFLASFFANAPLRVAIHADDSTPRRSLKPQGDTFEFNRTTERPVRT